VLDVQHLAFCDSSGLGALLRAHRTLREAGGACVVAGARGSVRRLLLLTHMERVLHLADEVHVALQDPGATASAIPDEPVD
jgi:anti-sigma B factor antagonist